MKNYSFFVFIVFCSALILLASSCKKTKQMRLQDVWKYVEEKKEIEQTHYEVWDFRSDGTLVVTKRAYRDLYDRTIIGRGPYQLKKKSFDAYKIQIDSIGNLYNGEWEVVALNKDELTILLEEPYIWKYRTFAKY
jgi:hypothetical protein